MLPGNATSSPGQDFMIIKNQLYAGQVELEFESFRHQYKHNGEVIPSVTTVLSVINKPALISWASKMAVESIAGQLEPGVAYDEMQLQAILEAGRIAHQKKKTDAGNMGTFIHNWVEKHIAGENPGMPVNEQMKKCVESFLEWENKYKVKFLVSEQMIYSRKFKYTGKLDFICEIDGKLYLGDLKTSSGIYPEMYIQTAAYRYARTEEFPDEKYEGQLIIRVDKESGAFQFGKCRDAGLYSKQILGFLAALKLYEVLQSLKGYKGEE